MMNPQLKVVNVEISKLKPSKYNPRKISDSAFNHLVESIRVHTLVEPLIASASPARKNILISGHQRFVGVRE
ncbi:MAG: ParB N-terminal domain-containing protein [Candidatus Saccharimonadales bacterium]